MPLLTPISAVRALWARLTRGARTVREQPDWERFVGAGWEDRVMSVEATDRHHAKQGRSIGRWVIPGDGGPLRVYLKRHFRLPLLHGLLATLFPGRAWSPGLQEWANLEWAAAHGFPVPRAVAAGQFVGPWARLQGFLAVEELHGMLPLHEAVPLAARRLDAPAFAAWKRGLTAELARLARAFHRRAVFHKDLYLCHFYIPDDLTRAAPGDWAGRVFVIDLHRLGRHPVTAVWWRVKDLAQLLYSSEVPGVTARDRVRFWRLYAGGRPGWLARAVRLKWALYRRHNRRRPKNLVPGTPRPE